jgi:chaperonin GroES
MDGKIVEQSQAPAMKAGLLQTNKENYIEKLIADKVAAVKVVAPWQAETSFNLTNNNVGVRPTGSFVLIEPVEQEMISEGGVAFPQISNRKSNEGIIRAVGPGRREFRPDIAERNVLRVQKSIDNNEQNVPMLENVYDYVAIDLNIGDRVLYVRWSGYGVEVDGKKLYLVEESNVVCVATREDAVLAFWSDRH